MEEKCKDREIYINELKGANANLANELDQARADTAQKAVDEVSIIVSVLMPCIKNYDFLSAPMGNRCREVGLSTERNN